MGLKGSLIRKIICCQSLQKDRIFKSSGYIQICLFLKTLYDQGDLAFISNVGSLIEPTSLSEYNAATKALPEGLFSHPDHQIHWQTLVPQVRGTNPKGWAGRMAETMDHANQQSNISMNISLSGTNVLQTGFSTVPYITDPSGVVQLKIIVKILL